MKLLFDIITILLQSIAGIYVLIHVIKINIMKNKKIIFISYLCFLTLMLLSNYFIPNYLRSIFSILVLTIIAFYLSKDRVAESLVSSIITVAIIAIVEVIFSLILILFGATQKQLIEIQYWNFIANFLISVTIIFLLSIKPISMFIWKFKKIVVKRKNLLYSLIIIFFFIYFIVAKNSLFDNVTLDMIINFAIFCFSILLFVVIFISDSKNNQLLEINHQMLNYVTKYEKIIAEQGKANHEFKNQLMVIRGYAQMNSPKLLEYLDSITEDFNKTHNSFLISQLNKFPDGGIKGLLYYKLSTMDEENIKYEINIEPGIKTKLKTLHTGMYKNITKILGVLLDNAIDASKQNKQKKVVISVINETTKVLFNIYNTYKGKIDLSKIATGYTSKGKGHGYGLRLVKDIIKDNKELDVQNSIENEYFVSSLIIKIQRKKGLSRN